MAPFARSPNISSVDETRRIVFIKGCFTVERDKFYMSLGFLRYQIQVWSSTSLNVSLKEHFSRGLAINHRRSLYRSSNRRLLMMTRSKKDRGIRGRRRSIHFPRYPLRKVVYSINSPYTIVTRSMCPSINVLVILQRRKKCMNIHTTDFVDMRVFEIFRPISSDAIVIASDTLSKRTVYSRGRRSRYGSWSPRRPRMCIYDKVITSFPVTPSRSCCDCFFTTDDVSDDKESRAQWEVSTMAIRLRVEYAATWRFSARGEDSGGLRTWPRLVYLRQSFSQITIALRSYFLMQFFPIAGKNVYNCKHNYIQIISNLKTNLNLREIFWFFRIIRGILGY